MSEVPKESRKQSQLQGIIDARNLCKYSFKILKNNNNFKYKETGDAKKDAQKPPQPELIGSLREIILSIYMSAYSANEVHLDENNYKHRRQLQDKSISKCDEALALIELAADIFRTPIKRVQYWSELILKTRAELTAWKKSDYNRIQKIRAKNKTK